MSSASEDDEAQPQPPPGQNPEGEPEQHPDEAGQGGGGGQNAGDDVAQDDPDPAVDGEAAEEANGLQGDGDPAEHPDEPAPPGGEEGGVAPEHPPAQDGPIDRQQGDPVDEDREVDADNPDADAVNAAPDGDGDEQGEVEGDPQAVGGVGQEGGEAADGAVVAAAAGGDSGESEESGDEDGELAEMRKKPFKDAAPASDANRLFRLSRRLQRDPDVVALANLLGRVGLGLARVDTRLQNRLINEIDEAFRAQGSASGISLPPRDLCYAESEMRILELETKRRFNMTSLPSFSSAYVEMVDIYEETRSLVRAVVLAVQDRQTLASPRMSGILSVGIREGGSPERFYALVDSYGIYPTAVFPSTANSRAPRETIKLLDDEIRAEAVSLVEKYREGMTDDDAWKEFDAITADHWRYLMKAFGFADATAFPLVLRPPSDGDDGVSFSCAGPLDCLAKLQVDKNKTMVLNDPRSDVERGIYERVAMPNAGPLLGKRPLFARFRLHRQTFAEVIADAVAAGEAVYVAVMFDWAPSLGLHVDGRVKESPCVRSGRERLGDSRINRILSKQLQPSHAMVATDVVWGEEEVLPGGEKRRKPAIMFLHNSWGETAPHPVPVDYFLEIAFYAVLSSASLPAKRKESTKLVTLDDDDLFLAAPKGGCWERRRKSD